MIDPNLLRNELEVIAKKLARRKFKLDTVTFHQKEERRKALQIEMENLQTKRNANSKAISSKKFYRKDIDLLHLEGNKIKERLNTIKIELNALRDAIRDYVLLLPNIAADEVPIGNDKNDNVEILRWGEPRTYNFPVRDHVELGEITGGLDFSAAVKLTGTRFVVMREQIAYLNRALIQFMLDVHIEQHGYKEYYLPYLVNCNSLHGTGHLFKFDKDLFHIKSLGKSARGNTYTLIPTAEIPLINLIRDEIIEEDTLPLKMTAHTPCFRSEAGSYGRDTRGLIRMHQFDKVEIVQIVKPETSMKVLEEMTGHAEKVLQLLNLPYRKILLCTGDIGFSSCKTYDLEVWLPAQFNYQEISSCSNTGDFQARRMKARFRRKEDQKLQLVHTLNGSGLAVGRTLAAILENYQLADGRIEIPVVLQPYMKGLIYIG